MEDHLLAPSLLTGNRSHVVTSPRPKHWFSLAVGMLVLCGAWGSPRLMAAALVPATIVTQPEDQTAVELLPVGFSVEATGNPVPRLQWFRNDVSIAKATNSTYTFTTTLADEGAVFRVEARNTVSGVPQVAISSNAVLHVTADLQGPLLLTEHTFAQMKKSDERRAA